MARCSGCWRPLPEPPPEPEIVQVPCTCGFLTLIERNVTMLPLRATLARVVDAQVVDGLLADSDAPADAGRVLEQAFDHCLRGAVSAVHEDPPAAFSAMWHTAVEFDRQSRRHRSGQHEARYLMLAASRALQLLYGCLSGREITAEDDLPVRRIQAFVSRFYEFASTAGLLSQALDNLKRGVTTARMRDGLVAVEKTPLHSRMQEWMINRSRIEREAKSAGTIVRIDELVSAAAEEAQRLWLGFAPFETGASLFANDHARLRGLASYQEETVYLIPVDRCPAEVSALFERFTLSLERIRNFEAPFYWDLGVVEESAAALEVSRRLARSNWLHYYPILRYDLGAPAYLASAEALTYAVADISMLKNGLLVRLDEPLSGMSGTSGELRSNVARLRATANRKFEHLAATRGRDLGFESAISIERVAGRRLQCGEIDVMWTGRFDGRTLIILAEVKDFDIVLHRVGGESALQGKVAAAERQLDAKASEVRRSWRTLLPEVFGNRVADDGSTGLLAKVLVTSQYLPPHLSTKYPMVTIPELGRLFESLRTWPDGFPPRFSGSSVEMLS